MTMTVRQLIEELENFDDDTPVHIAFNYGDYWRTTVTPGVKHAEELPVTFSDYHGMDKLDQGDGTDDDGEEIKYRNVVVLSATRLL